MRFQSMTGFARVELANEDYFLTVEAKSVNNRFRDVRIKMPSSVAMFELELKKIIEGYFKRGSLELSISLRLVNQEKQFQNIDENRVKAFMRKMRDLAGVEGGDLHFSATDFLRQEFLAAEDSTGKQDKIKKMLIEAVNQSALELRKSREKEGEKLIAILVEHKEEFKKYFASIESQASQYQASIEAKLRQKVSEFAPTLRIDEGRFLQEVVYYMEKLDVHEEINRLKSHLSQFEQLVSANSDEIGRPLDFLLQEFNRETNTIGSKSNHELISNNVVQMKIQLEKMREQALNLQ